MKMLNEVKEIGKFKREFDDAYKTNWSRHNDEEEKWKHFNKIQLIFLIIALCLIILGVIVILKGGRKCILAVVIIYASAIGITVLQSFLLRIKLKRTRYDKKIFATVEDALGDVFPGYKKMELPGKLSMLEVFQCRYTKALCMRFIKCSAYVCGILMEVVGILLGFVSNLFDLERVSTLWLFLWIICMLIVGGLQKYFIEVEAYNMGHYRDVAVKYKNMLIMGYKGE